MIKVHHQEDCEELYKLCGGVMNTLIEPGVKSASVCFSPEKIASCAPDKDHFMMHVIAMGDFEHYGFNKNGDAFPKEACEKYHPTFVSHGAFFREHRNRDKETQGIGHVKASAYNKEMGRIELLVHGHKKKAEEEYEMAKKANTLSVSMSCRVPYDISSITGTKAKSPAEYDEYCKHRMCQWIPEHTKYAYVVNDRPTFFDISRVAKPADRIAHYISYRFGDGEMAKAASASGLVVSGVDWAKFAGVSIPDFTDIMDLTSRTLLKRLADEEVFLDNIKSACGPKAEFAKAAAFSAFDGELTDAELEAFRKLRPGTMFRGLAKRAALLPFKSFAAYVTGNTIKQASEDPDVKRASFMLPSLFGSMLSGGSCCGDMENSFDSCDHTMSKLDPAGGDEVEKFMDDVGDRFSCESEPVKQRVIKITISIGAKPIPEHSFSGGMRVIKLASSQDKALCLAHMYGHYKLAALRDIANIKHGGDIQDTHILLAAAQCRI